MNVRVKLFAVAKELSGRDELAVDVPVGATIADLRGAIVRAHPALSNIVAHALWAIDAEYAGDDATLHEKSDVALIPPVSGG
jgi:molybdopterin converting factor small subunit